MNANRSDSSGNGPAAGAAAAAAAAGAAAGAAAAAAVVNYCRLEGRNGVFNLDWPRAHWPASQAQDMNYERESE